MSDPAWLLMAVDRNDRQFGGNDGYTDEPDVFYSWDNRVPNAEKVLPGHRIAVWDKYKLLGASVVESIAVGSAPKTLYRCKFCKKSSIKRRKALQPSFRCHNQDCRSVFDDPDTEVVPVKTFLGTHDAGWAELGGLLDGKELRSFCRDPNSQHAIRRLDWEKFRLAVESKGATLAGLDNRSHNDPMSTGGHIDASARVRRGQPQFRKSLLSEFGENCAVTGPCPQSVLEAGHLYSYAELGVHFKHGGLLLRRDVHSLFDRGAVAIHPETLKVSVEEDLAVYPTYAALDGITVGVSVKEQHKKWLRVHWTQHRGDTTY